MKVSMEIKDSRKKFKKIEPMIEDMTNADSEDEDPADEGNTESEDDCNESKIKGNPGWADVFQKILKTNKPQKKKTLVLSRAKKLSEVVPKQVKTPVSFEVEGETGEIKKEVITAPSKEEGPSKKQERKNQHRSLRKKPSISDRERGRTLQKIATKGVVQLFNAVKQQQTDLDKKFVEAGPLERKQEKVLKSIDKRAFLDVLMGGSKCIPVDSAAAETKSEDTTAGKVWDVLRDDFVMGVKLKDWDKNAPDEEASSEAEDMDSD